MFIVQRTTAFASPVPRRNNVGPDLKYYYSWLCDIQRTKQDSWAIYSKIMINCHMEAGDFSLAVIRSSY